MEKAQVGEVGVGAVEDNDLALGDIGTKFAGTAGIGLPGDVDQDKARQEALKIEAQVALGGGLAAAMAGPIQAVGHQFDGGRIDDVDGFAETAGNALAGSSADKGGRERLKVLQGGPEERLSQKRGAHLVGMRKPVAAWRGSSSNRRERSAMDSQGIADVVESYGVGELRIKQRHHMAPR
jgi:hypothetical protein